MIGSRRVAPEDIVVFLGPTLDRATAERHLPARYLPPVACGDVLRCLRLGPKAIAIIDGVFEHRAAVWHKEILLALERGVAVFGASSMGALRAAELAPFGMIGVGRIFESYRDGTYTDDDEVALLHGGAGQHRAISEPMVNIRATVAGAIDAGIIEQAVGDLVIARAKATFYQERSLRDAAKQVGALLPYAEPVQRLLTFVENGGHVDQKQQDALELLTALARLDRRPVDRRRARRTTSHTSDLQRLLTEVMCTPLERAHAWQPEHEQIAVRSRALGPAYTLLCDLARLLSVSAAVARVRKVQPRQKLDAVRRGRRHGWRRYAVALLRIHGEYERHRPRRVKLRGRHDSAVLRALEHQDADMFRLIQRMARLWEVVDVAARVRGVDLDRLTDGLQGAADDFRAERGLESRRATCAWLRRNDLDANEFGELIELWARSRLVTDSAHANLFGTSQIAADVCWFHDALRLTGFYARLEQDQKKDA